MISPEHEDFQERLDLALKTVLKTPNETGVMPKQIDYTITFRDGSTVGGWKK